MTENQKPPKRRSRALPKISDAEWLVMKTIHTLLSRLVQKGALEFERKGREYLFRPLVSGAECEQAATRSFLSRFFGGEIAPFLARFVEMEKMKPSEIEELKQILDRKSS